MKKEPTLVECLSCKRTTKEFGNYDKCRVCNDTKQVIDPKEILCSLCGGGMCYPDEGIQTPNGLHNITVNGDYWSLHLLDMHSYTFSLCEKCLRETFVKCKIKPIIKELQWDLNPFNMKKEGNEILFEQDNEIYEYMEWSRNGGSHQNYVNGLCNFVKDCKNKAIYTQFLSEEFTENCCCEEHKNKSKPINGKLVPFISNILKPYL